MRFSLPVTVVAALVTSLLATVPAETAAAAAPGRTAPGIDGEIVAVVQDPDENLIFRFDPADPVLSHTLVRHNVEADPVRRAHPSWSPGGQIAYSDIDRDAAGDPQRIYTLVPGTNDEKLLPSNRLADYEPAWSPTGDRIAFTTRVGGGSVAQCATSASAGSQIAYAADGDIFRIDSAGGTPTQLTSGSAYDSGPMFKPDGSGVGFWRSPGGVDMFEVGLDGGTPAKLAGSNGSDEYGPVYSPDGTKVAYVQLGGQFGDIWVRNTNGNGTPVKLTDGGYNTSPAWSCDGKKVLFAAGPNPNDTEIFTIKPDGTGRSALTDTAWAETDPEYSPDGTKIAFASKQHGDWDVMVMKADGSNAADPLHLTTSSADDIVPAWSPDGTRLAFTSNRSGRAQLFTMSATTPDSETRVLESGAVSAIDWGQSLPATYIYTMKTDGSDAQKVTLPINGGSPAWSPDGSRIAFVDGGRIFTIQPNGQGLAQLTAAANGTARDDEPSYSPDGSKVTFTGYDAQGRSSIYVVNVQGGTGLTKITTGTTDRSPVWSPSGTRIAFIRDGDIWASKPDGTGLVNLRDNDEASYESLDWGAGGVPDTVFVSKPGQTVSTDAEFSFSATRFPATFQCRLTGPAGEPQAHDWQDCGSMTTASSAYPKRSYQGLGTGHYTFYVRAGNSAGVDLSPESWQFDAAPGQLKIVKLGNGFGQVSGDRGGVSCPVAEEDCDFDVRGKVKLTAKAAPGSVFAGWTGKACSSNNATCTVELKGNPVFANATFVIDPSGLPRCSGSEQSRAVGKWTVRGCFSSSGGKLVSTDHVSVNGVTVYPIGGTLTLDTASQRLTASKQVQVMAGPNKGVGPIVLHRGAFDLDLSQDEFITLAPEDQVLGLPVTGAWAMTSDGAGGVVGRTTGTAPTAFGGFDMEVRFAATATGGLDPASVRVWRVSGDNASSSYDAALGEVFTMGGVNLRFVNNRGWTLDADLTLPGSEGARITGRLTTKDGEFSGGSFTLTNVVLAGAMTLPELTVESSNGYDWTMSSPALSRLAAPRRVTPPDCGAEIQRNVSGFTVPRTVGAAFNLLNFKIRSPRCGLWGNLVVVRNLEIGLNNILGIPQSFYVKGDVFAPGFDVQQLTGTVALNMRSASLTANQLNIDKIVSLTNVAFSWTTDGTDNFWTATATKDGPTGIGATLNVVTRGFTLRTASLQIDRFPLFRVKVAGFDVAMAQVRSATLTWTQATQTFDLTGQLDVPLMSIAPITGQLRFRPTGGIQSAWLSLSSVWVLGVNVSDMRVDWAGQPGAWNGRAYVALPYLAGVGANVKIDQGRLVALEADLQFTQPLPFMAGPGGLYRLRFGYDDRTPEKIMGGLGLQAGPTIFGVRPLTVDGTFEVYELPVAGCSGCGGLKIAGDTKLMGLQLGEASVDLQVPAGQLTVEGCLGKCATGLKLGPATVKGKVRGAIRVSTQSFQASGEAGANIRFDTPCIIVCGTVDFGVTGKAIVSNIGVAMCGGITGMAGNWQAGVGYKWGGSPEAFTGCDLGSYRSLGGARALVSRADAAAGAPTSLDIDVPDGLPVQAFRFTGTQNAPLVTLTGPDGTVINVDEDSLGVHGDYLVVADKKTKETVILVDAPAPGTWTLELQEGSSPLAKASSAEGLDQPDVTASVDGTTLSWSLAPQPGQVVRFVEMGEGTSQVITETSDATGSVGFTPAPGPAGTRTIVAEVTQDGLPRGSFEVATYDAPATAVLSVSTGGTGSGTITSAPAGISCGETCSTVLTAPVELTAVADPGSRFAGWTGACGGTETCSLTGAESANVAALFEKIVKPKITGLTPSSTKAGKTVTVKGTGLGYITSVRIGSVAVTRFTVVSASKLTFVVPSGAKSGKVTVTGPDGSATSPKKLTITKKR